MKVKRINAIALRAFSAILALAAITVSVCVSCSKGNGNEPDGDKGLSEGVRGDSITPSDDSWNILAGDLIIPRLEIKDLQVGDLGNYVEYKHNPDSKPYHIVVVNEGNRTRISLRGINAVPSDYVGINVIGSFQGQTLIIDCYVIPKDHGDPSIICETENVLNISFTVENIPSKFYLMTCFGDDGTGALHPSSLFKLYNVDVSSGSWSSSSDDHEPSEN